MGEHEGKDAPLSVSAAMAIAKGALNGVRLRLVGEVSEVSDKPGYKAVYFTVKDKGASLPCMMWKDRYLATGVRLVVGQLVELSGRFTLYAPRGSMNFEVFGLALAGEGKLRMQVANLARQLEAAGLMDPARKRPVPAYPTTVGLVTSPRGDAVHDVLRTLRRRFPIARVLLAGVAVEGKDAPVGIVEGISRVVREGAEVVLVVRGGGSFENLMPFNDERLARVIAACPVPVVTGIGHEPDTTIADMVADLRASTPTFAAIAVSPALESLQSLLAARGSALATAAERAVERASADVRRCATRPLFRDVNQLFATEAQALDLVSDRLFRAIPANLERDGARLERQRERLARALPASLERDRAGLDRQRERLARALPSSIERDRVGLERQRERLERALPARLEREGVRVDRERDRLAAAGGALVPRFSQQAGIAAARLNDLSPLAVLGRGWSIARTEDGAVVKSVEAAPAGSAVDVMVADGVLACRVERARRIDMEIVAWEDAS